jgi:hypothetical protein
MRHKIISALSLSAFLLTSAAWGESLTVWINKRFAEQATANIGKSNSATKQTGTSSENANPTSLVDHSSAADLISFALNQAGLSTGNSDTNSTSATATIFALYAALHGKDPLDPQFYNEHAALRRVALNLGFDEDGEGADKNKTRLYGLKWTVLDHRQPTEKDTTDLLGKLNSAAFSRGRVDLKVQAYLFKRPAMRDTIRQEYSGFLQNSVLNQGCLGAAGLTGSVDPLIEHLLSLGFGNDGQLIQPTLCEGRYFIQWVNAHAGSTFAPSELSEEDLIALDRIIGEEIGALVDLNSMTADILERAQTGPQLALIATYKDLPGSGHSYLGEMTFDYGLSDKLTLTLNGSYESTDGDDSAQTLAEAAADHSKDSWKVAGQLRYRLTKETPTRKAMYLDLAGDRTDSDGELSYKIQAKTALPLTGGISIPVSVTYASDADLIQEDDVRGQVGFSIDLSKLVESLRR